MSGLAAAASSQQQAQAQAQVNMAVAQKTLGMMESQGRSMVAMIEDAAQSQQEARSRAIEAGKGDNVDLDA